MTLRLATQLQISALMGRYLQLLCMQQGCTIRMNLCTNVREMYGSGLPLLPLNATSSSWSEVRCEGHDRVSSKNHQGTAGIATASSSRCNVEMEIINSTSSGFNASVQLLYVSLKSTFQISGAIVNALRGHSKLIISIGGIQNKRTLGF